MNIEIKSYLNYKVVERFLYKVHNTFLKYFFFIYPK